MNGTCDLLIPAALYSALMRHLLPGDHDEHAAVIAAGLSTDARGTRLLARELFLAQEGRDYLPGVRGYKALQASFIHRHVTYCRDQRLVYLAVHNHGGSGSVAFSDVDYASHERGYPALLDIAAGMPVGALVIAEGAIELDLWMPNGERHALREARIVGQSLQRQTAGVRRPFEPQTPPGESSAFYDRQVLLFGDRGQELLRRSKVAIIGLGGIGSLVSEYLARLGVGELVLVDSDFLEPSNFSRIVGARSTDLPPDAARRGSSKVLIADRVAREAQPGIRTTLLAEDFTREAVARQVLNCDFLILAADTMRARLVFNAIVHQYFIPGVQLGSKVTAHSLTGKVLAAFSVVRQVTPGVGCLLCNQLIDPVKLAEEWKTDRERRDQRYGTETPNPSVITLNAVSAAHAVNDFLFWWTALKPADALPPYQRFDHLTGVRKYEEPRRSANCTECYASADSRFGRGDAVRLPCAE